MTNDFAKRLGEKLIINGCNISQGTVTIEFSYKFPCCTCKKVETCSGLYMCNVAKYIEERTNTHTRTYGSGQCVLTINAATEKDLKNAHKVAQRAIKLRAHSCNKSLYR